MPEFQPGYKILQGSGELQRRAEQLFEQLSACSLCPWQCGVNRLRGETGQCRSAAQVRVYSYMAHHGEEKPLRGTKGSGTIFFSGCNMHCQYCQNSEISQEDYGMPVSNEKLAGMMLELQAQGCHNINLVSPSHVIAQIAIALVIAAKQGLNLPIVYNTGGYDKLETLQLLEGMVDIYMPDMKYSDEIIAHKYSRVPDYPSINQSAVKEMYRQVGDLMLDGRGIARRGLLVRHLLLPANLAGTHAIINFLANEISKQTYLNLMDQYHPEYNAKDYSELLQLISPEEYQQALTLAFSAGLERLER